MQLKEHMNWQELEFKMEWMYERRDVDYFLDELFDDAFLSKNHKIEQFIINEFSGYQRIIDEEHRMTKDLKDRILENNWHKNTHGPDEMINFYRRLFEYAIELNDEPVIDMTIRKYPIIIDAIDRPDKKLMDLRNKKPKIKDHSMIDIRAYNLIDRTAEWVFVQCIASPARLFEYISIFIEQDHFVGDCELSLRVALARSELLKDEEWYDSVVNDKDIMLLKLEYL